MIADEKGAFTFTDEKDDKGEYVKHYYNPFDLGDVNRIRKMDKCEPLTSLHGYCMSTGCSCRNYNGEKGLPICGMFKSYESDGIKKDFIHQLFGI